MMDYMEKEIEKRDAFIQGCWVKQEKMNALYIDDDMLKHRRAMDHINQNYDSNLFNHQSDRYQQTQKLNETFVRETNNYLKLAQRAEKEMERSNYGRYLDDNCQKDKHNPITNPIEYHIENPYLRARISRY